MRRLLIAATAGLALAIGLSGCTPAAPAIDSAEATSTYSPVVAEVIAALDEAFPGYEWTGTEPPSVSPGDGDSCVVWIKQESADFPVAETGDWASVIAAVNPVLEEHGFSAVGGEDSIPGGFRGIHSTDAAGAELRMLAKTGATITLEVPVSDTCD